MDSGEIHRSRLNSKLLPMNAINPLVRFTVICCLFFVSLANAAPPLIPSAPKLAAKGWFLIDANSGKVIAENNADEQLPPASLTKMMTSYVLSYELEQGNVHNNDQVTVSKRAWAKNFPGSSLMWIEVGKKVALEDLRKGIVISSGNDASVAVAEHIAGSEDSFAEVMNQHAELLGMTNTHFVNSHGLPHKEHYTTARDLAILSKAIINDYPRDYVLYSEKEFTFNGIRQPNRNTLLWRDPSVDGLKTGHTKAAGYCLVASAEKKGMRLITVVMGSKSEEARIRDTQKLLTYGFRYFETHKLYSAGDVLNTAKIWSGTTDQLNLGIDKDVYITIPRGQHKNVKAALQVDEVIKAPVSTSQPIGEVLVTLDDEQLAQQPLLALESVEQAGLFARLWDEIKLFFIQLIGLEL